MKKRSLKGFVCAVMLTLGLTLTACGGSKYANVEEYLADPAVAKVMDAAAQSYSGDGVDVKIKADGDKMVYEFKVDGVTKDVLTAEIVDAMAAALDEQAEQFESVSKETAEAIKVDKVIVVVRYLDENGEEFLSREYSAQ